MEPGDHGPTVPFVMTAAEQRRGHALQAAGYHATVKPFNSTQPKGWSSARRPQGNQVPTSQAITLYVSTGYAAAAAGFGGAAVDRARRDRRKLSVSAPGRAFSRGTVSSALEFRLHQRGHPAAFGAAGDLGVDDLHHLAHLRAARLLRPTAR